MDALYRSDWIDAIILSLLFKKMTLQQKADLIKEHPGDKRYMQWTKNTHTVIRQLKEELAGPIENDPLQTLCRIELRYGSVHRMFREALQIANEKFIFFQKQRRDMILTTNEYIRVDLSDKDFVFLQKFRSQINHSIREYTKYFGEMEIFFCGFRNRFSRFTNLGTDLLYIGDKQKEINLLKTNHGELTRNYAECIGRLVKIRTKTYHLMKTLKETEKNNLSL